MLGTSKHRSPFARRPDLKLANRRARPRSEYAHVKDFECLLTFAGVAKGDSLQQCPPKTLSLLSDRKNGRSRDVMRSGKGGNT